MNYTRSQDSSGNTLHVPEGTADINVLHTRIGQSRQQIACPVEDGARLTEVTLASFNSDVEVTRSIRGQISLKTSRSSVNFAMLQPPPTGSESNYNLLNVLIAKKNTNSQQKLGLAMSCNGFVTDDVGCCSRTQLWAATCNILDKVTFSSLSLLSYWPFNGMSLFCEVHVSRIEL